MNFTAKQREEILKGIHSGKYSPVDLPIDLCEVTVKKLKNAVKKGLADYEGELLESLNDNVSMFSSAKTFQQTLDMHSLLSEDLTEDEFMKEAGKRFDLYNETYLDTEENTVLLQSQNARDWANIEEQKDALPLLRYSAVIDDNTAEVCRQCDGVVKPVDDPFWDMYSPENHFNCRCLTEQLDDEHSEVEPPEDLVEPAPVFNNNVGKTGEIFNKHHPYFDVPKEYKEFAKENFGLPID